MYPANSTPTQSNNLGAPVKRNSVVDPQVRELTSKEPTKGLIDALGKWEKVHEYMSRLQGSSSRKALNALDANMPSGPDRERVRKEFLDAIGFFRREIEQWLQSQSEPIPETAEKNSVP